MSFRRHLHSVLSVIRKFAPPSKVSRRRVKSSLQQTHVIICHNRRLELLTIPAAFQLQMANSIFFAICVLLAFPEGSAHSMTPDSQSVLSSTMGNWRRPTVCNRPFVVEAVGTPV
jgi:hypothetical protein